RTAVPAVTGADGEALEVIRQVAGELSAPLLTLGSDFAAHVHHSGWDGLRLTVEGLTVALPGLPLTLHTPLVGRHQAANVAIAAVSALLLGMSPARVVAAFSATRWPGRLERFDLERAWVLDGAHNRQAALALAGSVSDLGTRPAAVVLEPLVRLSHAVIASRASSWPRALAPTVIADVARALGAADVHEAAGLAAALDLARRLTSKGELVLVAGSLFLVGEARSLLREAPAEGR